MRLALCARRRPSAGRTTVAAAASIAVASPLASTSPAAPWKDPRYALVYSNSGPKDVDMDQYHGRWLLIEGIND